MTVFGALKIFDIIKLALMIWSATKLQALLKRSYEIDNEIDNAAIDATKSDMLRIKRLADEKARIAKYLSVADSVLREVPKGKGV
jgi:hypothetical protein